MNSSTTQLTRSAEQVQSQAETFQLSDNYFEGLNTQYRQEILSGNGGQDTIRELITRNRQGKNFINVVVDFFKNPRAAFQWMATKAFGELADNWFVEITGIETSVRTAQEAILSIANNPISDINDALRQFSTLTESSLLQLTLNDLTDTPSTISKLTELQNGGRLIIALIKLKSNLEANPETVQQISRDNSNAQNQYTEILRQSGYEDQAALVTQVLNGEVTLANAVRQRNQPQTQAESITFTDEDYSDRLRTYNAYKNRTNPNDPIDQQFPYQLENRNNIEFISSQMYVDQTRYTVDNIQAQIQRFRTENQHEITALATATTIFGALRFPAAAAIGQTRNLAANLSNNVTQLITLPLKIGPIPIAIVGAAIAGTYIYIQQNPMVPHDITQAKEQILNTIKQQPFYQELARRYDNSTLESHLSTAIESLTDQEKRSDLLNEGITFAGEVARSAVENITLTPSEQIEQTNQNWINQFSNNLRINQLAETDAGQSNTINYRLIQQAVTEFQNKNPKTTADYQALLQNLQNNGIITDLNEDSGFYFYIIPTDPQIGPNPLFIDFNLETDDQIDIAQNRIGVAGTVLNNIRLGLGELYQNFNPDRDLNDQLFNFLGTDGIIGFIGDSAYLISSAAGTKYLLGPIELAWELIRNIPSINDDDSKYWTEALTVYSGNLVPVVAFTLGREAINRVTGGQSRNLGLVLLDAASYPITGPLETYRTLRTADGRLRFRTGIDKLSAITSISTERLRNSFRTELNPRNIESLYKVELRRELIEAGNAQRNLFNELHNLIRGNQTTWAKTIEDIIPDNLRNKIYQRSGISTDRITTITEADAQTVLRNLTEHYHDIRRVSSSAVDLQIYTISQYIQVIDPPINDNTLKSLIDRDPRVGQLFTETGALETYIRQNPALSRLVPESNITAINTNFTRIRTTTPTWQVQRSAQPVRARRIRRGGRAAAAAAVAAAVGGGMYTLLRPTETTDEVGLETAERLQSAAPESAVLSTIASSYEDREVQSAYPFLTELNQINTSYREVRAFLNPANLMTLDDQDRASIIITDLGTLHENQIQRFNQYIRTNKEQFISFFNQNPSVRELPLAEGNYVVSLDPEDPTKLKIKYSDQNAFIQTLWENYDEIRSIEQISSSLNEEGLITKLNRLQTETAENIEQISQNQELSNAEKTSQIQAILETFQTESNQINDEILEYARRITAGSISLDILPVTGHARDLNRVRRSIERGNFGTGLLNAGLFAATSFADLVSGATAGVATRAVAASSRLTRVATRLRAANATFRTSLNSYRAGRGTSNILDFAIRHNSKILWGAIGFDMARGFIIPPSLNQETNI